MKRQILLCFGIIIAFLFIGSFQLPDRKVRPKISFSFDDGSIRDFPNYTSTLWNEMILNTLKKNNLQAILFVKGKGLDNKNGMNIITSWNNAGHLIGNHTYNHPYFNSPKVSLAKFKKELLKNDSLINQFSNYTKLFRFPYLKEGNTIKKRDGFRDFLKRNGYKNGHVTIDASDWYIDSRLVKRLKQDSTADISGYKQYYIKHIFDRAQYYNALGLELTGRQISHNLLLHHNLSAGLFLDDLIKHFKKKGWEIVDVRKAYQDKIYDKIPTNIPAGESLIWALAKQSGKYDSVLRYPAESGKYEKAIMDDLGL